MTKTLQFNQSHQYVIFIIKADADFKKEVKIQQQNKPKYFLLLVPVLTHFFLRVHQR